jgi:hypothetical protein
VELTDGFGDVLQHEPRAVTSSPPLFVTLPPETALVVLIAETFEVVRVGIEVVFLQYCIIVRIQPVRNTITIIFSKLFMAIVLCL